MPALADFGSLCRVIVGILIFGDMNGNGLLVAKVCNAAEKLQAFNKARACFTSASCTKT
ncbi:MAG: hypothetical protein Q8L41_12275 [Anaerolineales bacterium]|nr:hypothetical protein [Anaerolineales bacterium]MDP2778717.1 hypothetical protein [Anaerolineales bacterium]